MKFSNWQQGSPEWLQERRGLITASRFRDALDVTAKGAPSAKAKLYAQDLARERCGGTVFGPYVNAQMRYGTEQESLARIAYEIERGVLVTEVGFFKDDDERFGISTDGLVDDDGAIEIKTIASSDVLFTVLVEKDYSSFVHQICGNHWLLARQWVDLVLWTPDLPRKMHVIRFERDETMIELMEAKLIDFSREVDALTDQLASRLK
jgi:exodeoxyribonuclease (lambda-induced)